jgi:hypothetical protein
MICRMINEQVGGIEGNPTTCQFNHADIVFPIPDSDGIGYLDAKTVQHMDQDIGFAMIVFTKAMPVVEKLGGYLNLARRYAFFEFQLIA